MTKIIDKVDLISTKKLIPYRNNPKEHPIEQIEKIASSIEQYGFTQPIVISEDNEIIIGHGRVGAAEKLGLEKIPAIRRDDLTENEIRALRIADNKVAESAWDIEALALELEEIDFEELEIGFELEEIEGIEAEIDKEQKVAEDNFDCEIDEEKPAITEQGDLIELGKHRLMCGDSTQKRDVEELMAGKRADMVFTDPPYGLAYSGKGKGSAEENKDKWNVFAGDDLRVPEWQTLLKTIFNEWRLKDNSDIYICIDWRRYPYLVEVLPSEVKVWNCIVWKKNFIGLGYKYRYTHEFILYGSIGEPQLKRKDISDVWEIDRDATSEYKHPTQKPIKIPGEAVRNSSSKNDIVLDSFGGSGSTLIACEQLDRSCYMMELDEAYCDVIVRRYIEYKLERAEEVNIKINGKEVDYDDYL